MLSKFYTLYLQGIFAYRERELNRLEQAKEELKKARLLAKRLWFISKGGFTSEAMDFATHERILLTDKEGLERLAKLLKVRFKG